VIQDEEREEKRRKEEEGAARVNVVVWEGQRVGGAGVEIGEKALEVGCERGGGGGGAGGCERADAGVGRGSVCEGTGANFAASIPVQVKIRSSFDTVVGLF
jgi:hypothetical protein